MTYFTYYLIIAASFGIASAISFLLPLIKEANVEHDNKIQGLSVFIVAVYWAVLCTVFFPFILPAKLSNFSSFKEGVIRGLYAKR